MVIVGRLQARVGKVLSFFIDDVQLRTYVVVLAVVVLTLGEIYSVLTPYGHGVTDGSCTKDVSYWNGVYFSVVTVSSLGYGDLRPVGASRVVACMEVIFGLAWFGVVIAKLTSRRLSYHVQRLFSSDARRRLEEFVLRYDECKRVLLSARDTITDAYMGTPGSSALVSSEAARLSLDTATEALSATSASFAEYVSYETEQAQYFAIVPTDILRRLGATIDDVLFCLVQLIISLPLGARTDVLDPKSRERISAIVASHETIGNVMTQHSKDEKLRSCAARVLQNCTGVLQSYFTKPIIPARSDQPNQVLQSSNQPQEPE